MGLKDGDLNRNSYRSTAHSFMANEPEYVLRIYSTRPLSACRRLGQPFLDSVRGLGRCVVKELDCVGDRCISLLTVSKYAASLLERDAEDGALVGVMDLVDLGPIASAMKSAMIAGEDMVYLSVPFAGRFPDALIDIDRLLRLTSVHGLSKLVSLDIIRRQHECTGGAVAYGLRKHLQSLKKLLAHDELMHRFTCPQPEVLEASPTYPLKRDMVNAPVIGLRFPVSQPDQFRPILRAMQPMLGQHRRWVVEGDELAASTPNQIAPGAFIQVWLPDVTSDELWAMGDVLKNTAAALVKSDPILYAGLKATAYIQSADSVVEFGIGGQD
ncbi:MAG: hypothetical protein ACTS3F_03165 [Phycisphaerales bacterium]